MLNNWHEIYNAQRYEMHGTIRVDGEKTARPIGFKAIIDATKAPKTGKSRKRAKR